MHSFIKVVIGFGMLAAVGLMSGCSEAPAPSGSKNSSNHGDEQMWQQFQSKQATDQLDKDFQK